MQLLERDDILQRLEKLLAAAGDGEGRAVLVRGEAGMDKTSAVRAFTDSHLEDAHVLWGGDGDWEGAASFWKEGGIPYNRVVALSHGDTDARIEALGMFDDLGAIPVAARLRSELARPG